MIKTSNLLWKGIKIGEFVEESMDMGYLDGKLILDESEYSKKFVSIVSNFDFKSIILAPKKGIRAVLNDGTTFLTHVLVLGLSKENRLSLKMIVGKQETIDWYLTNVREEI